jgi:diaminopimelate epimerase
VTPLNITFYKYQGTGNDFVIVDNREGVFGDTNAGKVAFLCDRRFGIGADGLMLLQDKEGYDFEMVYFNSDGRTSSMCGNGGRCIVAFAKKLGVINDSAHFIAADGDHYAKVEPGGWVSLGMNDVKHVEIVEDHCWLNTGSPHYVKAVKGVENYDVFSEGRKVRYSDRFAKEGTNVNFIEPAGGRIFVRTYERGVEDETYSCGTGVTAAALVASLKDMATGKDHCDIKTLGGDLRVRFNRDDDNSFSGIWLEGPAEFVFKGEIEV